MTTIPDHIAGALLGILERRAAGALGGLVMDTIVGHRVRRVHGPASHPIERDSVVVLSVVQNAADTLPAFLEHYERLGVSAVVLLDNGSTDATVDIARRFGRITVLASTLPFGTTKFAMRRYLLRRYARDGWALLVDADELFEYPCSDRLPLRGLIAYLDRHGYTAVVGQMLDLFPSGALQTTGTETGSLRRQHRLFDISGVRSSDYRFANAISNPAIKLHFGGVRGAAFGTKEILLTKHPLLRPRRGVTLTTSHEVRGARLADFSSVLYHYKFAGDFRARVEDAVRHGHYYAGSAEYRQYQQVLDAAPDLTLDGPHAEQLESPDQLVERGFLVVSEQYRRAGCGAS